LFRLLVIDQATKAPRSPDWKPRKRAGGRPDEIPDERLVTTQART